MSMALTGQGLFTDKGTILCLGSCKRSNLCMGSKHESTVLIILKTAIPTRGQDLVCFVFLVIVAFDKCQAFHMNWKKKHLHSTKPSCKKRKKSLQMLARRWMIFEMVNLYRTISSLVVVSHSGRSLWHGLLVTKHALWLMSLLFYCYKNPPWHPAQCLTNTTIS